MNSNKNQMLFEDTSYAGNEQRKKIHIPFCDVDDLAFKNRHDPNFIASISKLFSRFPFDFEQLFIILYFVLGKKSESNASSLDDHSQ